jgi:hypothetical protein
MAFLVALSALVISVKPIVDRFSTAGGWVLAGIGITAATTSVHQENGSGMTMLDNALKLMYLAQYV